MPSPRIPVSAPEASWQDIWQFALTYNGYERHGDFDDVARLSKTVAAEWRKDALLPNDLAELRCALFFEQRRFRHLEMDPEGSDADYVRALVASIRQATGGSVEGPADGLP